ncbi:MAG: LamG-like jellyroll fold domain-containing protein, partial [Armatimonadota bacterium]
MCRLLIAGLCVVMVACAFASDDIEPYEPDENTLLLYHFDGEGDSIVDSSGNGFDGVMEGGEPVFEPGLIGKSLRLAEGQVILPQAPNERVAGMDELTLEVWFRFDEDRQGHRQRVVMFWEHYLISIWESGTIFGHIYDHDGKKTRLAGRSIVHPGVWNHAALTYDGAVARLYVNGIEEASGRMTGPVNPASGRLQINSYGDDYFAGHLDEVRISTVARKDFAQARRLHFVSLVNQTALSPGAWRVNFNPVVPADATELRCRAGAEGIEPVEETVADSELEPAEQEGWKKFGAQLRVPVPEGLPEQKRMVECSVMYELDGEEHSRTTSIPAYIDPLLPPPAKEVRAAWTHYTRIPDPDEMFGAMESAGVNTAIMRIRRGETAFYNSTVGPLSKPPDFDHTLEDAIEAAHRHNIDIHPYVNCFNIGQPDSEFAQDLKEQGRWAKTYKGEDVEWLCPSFEENREIVKQGMIELVRDYEVDGIQYDFIRYANADSCYCDHCRAMFEEHIGRKVQNWPEDVREGGPL